MLICLIQEPKQPQRYFVGKAALQVVCGNKRVFDPLDLALSLVSAADFKGLGKAKSMQRTHHYGSLSPMAKITPAALIFIIATIPLLFGAVQPPVWSIYAGMMFCVFIFDMWRDALDFGFIRNPWFMSSVGLFFIFTLLQAIPLPGSLLKILDPVSYQVLAQSSALLGENFSWHAIAGVPTASMAWWIFLFGVLLFFGLLRSYLADTRNLMTVVGVMMSIALFEGLYGLLQALIPSLGVLWVDSANAYVGDARGTFINRNHFAGFIEMVWPVGLGVVLSLSRRRRESPGARSFRNKLKIYLSSDHIGFLLSFTVALLFILLALLFSKSRAGITGAFIGFAAFVLLAHAGGRRFSAPAWICMGLGFCFLLFYGNVIGFEELIGRFLATDDNIGSRADIWRDTLSMIKDHPLGVGLQNFATVFPIYNSLGPPGIKYTHAHNDYLQLLAEAGWPGFVALTGGFFVFLGKSVLRIRKLGPKTNPTRFYITIGACSGLISMAFHSFFDFNLQIPANLLYFVVLIAIVESD